VAPVAGNCLVFPHGDSAASLVHEGAAVTRGVKYIIRTDVLYKLPPGGAGHGDGAAVDAGARAGEINAKLAAQWDV
jgi:hypothetical protein